ncbi:MAG TPA: hypothetical protein VEI97_02530, partial [bacterium]|nr:hypothetical protein [bacterium]
RKFKPGDTIRVKVTLKPYRKDQIEEILTLQVPTDIATGQTSLEIRGGGRLPSIFQISPEAQGFPPGFSPAAPQQGPPEPPDSLEDLLEVFSETERMNDLVLELYRPGGQGPEGMGPSPSQTGGNVLDGEEVSEDDDSTPEQRDAASVRNLDEDSEEDHEEEPIKTTLTTDRVIFGTVTLPVEIVSEDSEETGAQEGEQASEDEGSEKDREEDAEADREERGSDRDRRKRGYRQDHGFRG